MTPKRVIIVGGGFAGLQAARGLGGAKEYSVTVIDRRNYHLFQPLLYQVAMAGLSPAEIAAPIRALLSRYANIEVLLGNVVSVDLKAQKVNVDFGELTFDYLILACGAKHSYFGHEDWEPLAPGLKTLEQATEIRRRVLTAFELAERESDSEKRKQLLTFIVVGGGPTGVELAGAIGEISRHTLVKDFRHIHADSARVILLEAGQRILPSFSADLSAKAARDLEGLGVQVWTWSRVTSMSEDGVRLGEESIRAKTVLWAAGVEPSSLNRNLGVAMDERQRVKVQGDLSLEAFPNVFVLGDQAAVLDRDNQVLPGLAPVAIQQGRYVARILRLEAKAGKRGKSFRYVDKGQMATIGRRSAVLQLGRLHMSGTMAWLAWLFVHIYYLIGFKNRLFVFLQWAWHYLSYSRGARLIMQKEWRSFKDSPR